MGRKISWVSAIDPENNEAIAALEEKLSSFYSSDKSYYSNIDYTGSNWDKKEEIAYVSIKEACRTAEAICEIGCGAANILKSEPLLSAKYSGCDFSAELMKKNHEHYPAATFNVINEPNKLPFADNSFDLLFSVFVLEHVTRPHLLLDECRRVLKKGGRLIIFCPDFLGRGRMSSQQGGLSDGTPSQKLKKGKLLDCALTFYDNRIKLPRYCKRMLRKQETLFLINIDPTVFYFKFHADVDAVYVTNKVEIAEYLSSDFEIDQNGPELRQYEIDKRLIYLSMLKKA